APVRTCAAAVERPEPLGVRSSSYGENTIRKRQKQVLISNAKIGPTLMAPAVGPAGRLSQDHNRLPVSEVPKQLIAQSKMLTVGYRRAILECYPLWRRVTS